MQVGTNSPCLLRMQTQKPPEQKITVRFKLNLKTDGLDYKMIFKFGKRIERLHSCCKQCRRIYICLFCSAKYLLGIPKPFQNCTVLAQALKETRSYFFTPLIARIQNAIILRKETMFLVFSPNWLERYCNECGSQCNERADSEIS